MNLLNSQETPCLRPTNLTNRTQRKIVFLSPRGGTGKSSFIANIATSLASKGLRIGIVDLDLKSPSLGAIFNIDEKGLRLNDFLLGRCPISSCVLDLGKHLSMESNSLFLLSPSPHTTDILTIYEKGYSIDKLALGLANMAKDLKLDFLLIDTCSGLDEDALVSMLMGDHAVILSRSDKQSRVGTNIIITALQKLGYAEKGRSISLIINNAPPTCDMEKVRKEFEEAYGCRVLAVIPFYMEVLSNANSQVLFLKDPSHPFSAKIAAISKSLLDCLGA